MREECDWADFRRTLGLPNGNGNHAGRFGPLYWTLQDLYEGLASNTNRDYDFCNRLLLWTFVQARWVLYSILRDAVFGP
jgi:hypothetical protein